MKNDGRKIARAVLAAHRRTAVKLRRQGVTVATIARSCGVTPKAVYGWLKNYRLHGLRGLRIRKATGRPPELSAAQFEELLGILRRPATAAGYATALWSGPRVRHLLKARFAVEYHPKHLPRFLRRLGLVLKFPERRALEQDPAALRRWKKERLPALMASARRRGAVVFYADESLIALIPYVGKTWAFPGTHPVVRVSGRRGQHVGVTAAVNAQGRLCFELTRAGERFTAHVFLRFVRKLLRENSGRPLVLIVDGAPIHKAKLVRAFAREHRRKFRLELLPAYSPECNPTEKSWNFVKTKKMNACAAADKMELRHCTQKAMKELKSDPTRVASFFVDIK
jgi:transposase